MTFSPILNPLSIALSMKIFSIMRSVPDISIASLPKLKNLQLFIEPLEKSLSIASDFELIKFVNDILKFDLIKFKNLLLHYFQKDI